MLKKIFSFLGSACIVVFAVFGVASHAWLEWKADNWFDSICSYVDSFISGTPLDREKVKAENGDADAQYNLASMYYSGKYCKRNYSEALKWMRRAAEEHGHTEAQFFLGYMYHEGIGTARNYPEAARWLHKAAEQEHAKAQCLLGIIYAAGHGVTKNDSEAIKWMIIAAMNGDETANAILSGSDDVWQE